jgi:hypothetical protein
MGGYGNFRPSRFFYQTLLTGDPTKIYAMIDTMEKNRKAIKTEVSTLTFYMQGGLDFNDAYILSAEDRTIMSKVIEKHYEAVNGNKGNKLIG